MSPIRLVTRWSLTLVALLLASLALLLLALRLALAFADGLTPNLEALLSARFGAEVRIAELDTRLAGLDPSLSLDALTIEARTQARRLPLLEVESGQLRLDALASLRAGMPVVEDARLSGVTLHLYQTPEGGWHWPDPAELPPELQPSGELDLERLDFWVGVLLRQRAWADDVRVVLHGRERRVVLEAPRLLMTGDDRRAHLEGTIRLEGEPDAAMEAALEVFPGPGGFRDFSAALQADMKLDSLIGLVEVLGRDDPLRLDESSGQARLWGRWHRGQLADARLDLAIARLAVSRADNSGSRHAIELTEVEGSGQWLRRDGGWEAWFEGDAVSPESVEPDAQEAHWGPALPHRWQLTGDVDGWWLNTSGFDLGSLAAWRHRLPLPEALARVVDTLDPRGQVNGFRLGHRDGQWLARAALGGVEVSPWEQAPGGGPLDIWVEARDLTGRVRFAGAEGATLHFPELFAAPMALDHAAGEVLWTYDGPRSVVSGRDLRVGWNGAEVEGGFGLSVGGEQRGGFGLTLGFREVDAVETPLAEWLPVGILGDELREWLDGVAGRVSQGALRMHVPIAGGAERIDPSFGLELAIEEGRLAFDPAWPALEAVEGHLSLQDNTLEARVERAESLGVTAHDGQVRLIDERLEVDAELAASAQALRRYLMAMPVEGVETVADWQAEGEAEGRVRLALPLGEPEGLELTVDTEAAFPRLEYRPLELVFSNLSGPLSWRQRGEEGGLEGRIQGRLLGGPIRADVDTPGGGLDLSGRAEASALARWAGVADLNDLVVGGFDWQGRLAIGENRLHLGLDSGLEGLGIALPDPLGKAAGERRPLRLDMDLAEGRLEGRLGEALSLRWRALPGDGPGQGQVWLGRAPAAGWPQGEGWWIDAYRPRLDPATWAEALGGLGGLEGGGGAGMLRELRLATDCLLRDDHCLGSLTAEGRPQAGGGWRLALDGSLLAGQLDYRPNLAEALDVSLTRLSLDGLMPQPGAVGSLLDEIATPPEPAPLPGWVGELPDGRLRIADIERDGQRLGPFNAHWQARPERLSVSPLGLTLGQISARGELVWEATGSADTLTRARLELDGRDLGTAMETLGQPAMIRSAETRVSSQLAWPGAPWQFALERSRGSVEVELLDGRFVNVASTPARLVGLLNVDNLVRRLRLDFSDVTGQGTAFDRVSGAATLYGGTLETRGPVTVDGPATRFTLEGRVDLARRELDQRLGVTVPISRNLPLAAVIAGAPVVGGALFIADRLFGDAIDRVTRIHYRVRGPWTSPQISVESAE